jgi:hypothetical protein
VLDDVQALLIGNRKLKALSEAQRAEFASAESWDGDELYLRKPR